MRVGELVVFEDEEVKKQACKLFSERGLDMATAINLFLEQVVRQQEIPFDVSAIPIKPKKVAKLGGGEGRIWMSDDFNAPMNEYGEYT